MMRFKKGPRPNKSRLDEPPTEPPDRVAPKRQGTALDRQKAAEEREKNEQAAIAELEKLRQKRCDRTARLRELRLGQEGSPPNLVKPRSTAIDPPRDHKFRIGQKVALAMRPLDGSAVQDCEVSRLLPADNADRLDVRYRIREIGSGRERVVKESDLADEIDRTSSPELPARRRPGEAGLLSAPPYSTTAPASACSSIRTR